MYETPPGPNDELRRKIDQIFMDLLFNPRGDISEEVLRITNQLQEDEVISKLTDEELKERIQKAAQSCLDDRELEKKVVALITGEE
jgi:hypothetical protein